MGIENCPLVSVLMSVYNGEEYLCEAIESILAQTYRNFEFIIVNDGSTDGSETIILKYAQKDKRIIYVKNEVNIRLVASLNKGISIAKGKYIVRMDADDISVTERIEKQVVYMEGHPDVGVCGSFFKVFGEGRTSCISRKPESDTEIRASLLTTNPLGHPNVIIRKSYLIYNKIQYDEKYYRMEDWGLWISLMPFCKFHNIQEVLLNYRYVKTSESRTNAKDKKHLMISGEIIKSFFLANNIECDSKDGLKIAALLKAPHVYSLTPVEVKDSFLSLTHKLVMLEPRLPRITEITMKRLIEYSLKKHCLFKEIILHIGFVRFFVWFTADVKCRLFR